MSYSVHGLIMVTVAAIPLAVAAQEGPVARTRANAAEGAVVAAIKVLTGFRTLTSDKDVSRGSAGRFVRRSSDGLNMMVDAYVGPSDADVDHVVEVATGRNTSGLRVSQTVMPEGTPSGRKLGQHAYWSAPPRSEPLRGALTLIVRDGPSFVSLRLMARIPTDENGRPAYDEYGRPLLPVISRADALMAEAVAVRCLNELTVAGYTSRSGERSRSTGATTSEPRSTKAKG